jgi:signal transduction histidine kinase
MILYLNHIVELRFNLENYSYKLSNWLTLIFAGLMVIIMLKTIVEELLGKIEKINTDLEKQNAEVKLLNDSLENKVNERTEDLYRTNKEKDRILGVIAHDVNNRIGGIATLLDMVQNQELNAEEEKEFIKLACDTCFSTVDIIRDLLEYSKNIGDQTEIFLEQVNLNDFIRSSVELYKLNAHKKSVKIIVNEPQSSIFCKLNKLKFSRVMDNLISNAIKFSLPDGKIEISCYEENNKVYISIKDNGIGIPDNIKDKIFIPFSGAGRVGTNKEESNGLGLSIVKNIVEKHQGKIWFESVKNQGTTFYICLTSK